MYILSIIQDTHVVDLMISIPFRCHLRCGFFTSRAAARTGPRTRWR